MFCASCFNLGYFLADTRLQKIRKRALHAMQYSICDVVLNLCIMGTYELERFDIPLVFAD